ncbi:spore germination protein [Rossellomorea aquimaris]|uniref:GerAB/ArcD/ProY family transporter n=1 Tax=Rossellomorea aquimaris TaxID=189382 RepID=UPI001CD3AA69|nr:GerAB/ArcD/ProY family transporter [Rossellomorea aquimaris]MCA1055492.1 spore germination protein [Rossellomorea aquimaris]
MLQIPERNKISPGLVFFLVHSIQVGGGVLGFQRIIARNAGYDGWIAVILAGIFTHILMIIMYKLVELGEGDIVSVHALAFGKWLGKIFDMIFVLYFSLLVITILRTYIEVLQVWMYPRLSTFIFSLSFLLLCYYFVNGGVRVITGTAFFGTILPSYLALSFAFTFPYADFRNILPVFDHSLKDILISTKNMSLTYLGYESIVVLYPFIKNAKQSQKYAHWGLFTTTMGYTIIALISFAFFSEKQLEKTVWATLSMWKIVEMPFVERFEYIGIANWCLIILPNVCITLWCASRILKRMTPMKHRHSLVVVSILCLSTLSFFTSRHQVNFLNDWAGRIGFYINFIYLPLLLLLVILMKKVRKKS